MTWGRKAEEEQAGGGEEKAGSEPCDRQAVHEKEEPAWWWRLSRQPWQEEELARQTVAGRQRCEQPLAEGEVVAQACDGKRCGDLFFCLVAGIVGDMTVVTDVTVALSMAAGGADSDGGEAAGRQ